MSTAWISHPACLEHDTGLGHPEAARRLTAIEDHLRGTGLFDWLDVREAPEASTGALLATHPQAHLDALTRTMPAHGLVHLDPDTPVSPGSWRAALRAAGAVVHGVELVLDGVATNAFCAVRPPGHHAEPTRAMGFCLLNNVAIGAAHALARGLRRVAVVDFDVHHGNGTEAIFRHRDDVLVCSAFQHPYYPYTDLGATAPNIIAAPLPAGTGSGEFRAAVEDHLVPALERYAPELVLISAGFDGHGADPLADWHLATDDYAWVTDVICTLAARHARRRVVATLEGGYALDALARSVAAHVETLIAHGY
jgi:acetoin utilization deacetylase AcuC-like enzyme